ncbi:FACT complex subunit SSRP1-like [Sinocyclocheilus rhinocerous]|uniref:FACT complex subunit SSRP1-like n=1 Tax=Sinocyclocheilus rhinocerous TaxID=307959 RepID=UPI0007BA5E93|nr:PREDICTED: FACT complex subunit SSRP1-like [Sinocyclocheilus rhinocerous]
MGDTLEFNNIHTEVKGSWVGSLLSFDVSDSPVFEIPLSGVSQCATGKNEVTVEFHQNDDAEVSLMEVRFYVPPNTGDDGSDPVEAFAQNVLSKADVIQATGDAVCVFKELQCLTPRGRYDIRIYPTFLHLHGKTFDYKIPYTTVLRLFLLPHKDQRQMFFVISLDPPIKQGQTRYHFLILLFSKDEELSLALNMSEDEVEKRYEGKLSKNMSGPLYEIVSRVMKALVNRKITVPGNFQGRVHGMKGADGYSDSDEDQHDAYLERMKEEGKIREEGDGSDESEGDSDESFNPGEEDDDVPEEYDSNASESDSEADDGDSEEESKKKKPEKKPKKVVKEKKERKPRKEKKVKDPGAPKRPMSAYMLWLNASRERIKSENPGISVTEISKKAGEMWKQLSKDRKENILLSLLFVDTVIACAFREKKKKGGKVEAKKKSGGEKETKEGGNESFKSKEFISSEESSSESDHDRGSKRKASDDDEEAASTPASSEEESGSD